MAVDLKQPIIRGIQAVGNVELLYRYNKPSSGTDLSKGWVLPIPSWLHMTGLPKNRTLKFTNFLSVAGFRLDSEFLRANPQLASSFQIPVLGGGGIALTNNNRTGTLNLVCPQVCSPSTNAKDKLKLVGSKNSAIGVLSEEPYYDMVTLARIQQGQESGDSYGSTIVIAYNFCGQTVKLQFEGCTIATVDPVGIAGNDAVNYNIAINYLNWQLEYGAKDTSEIKS